MMRTWLWLLVTPLLFACSSEVATTDSDPDVSDGDDDDVPVAGSDFCEPGYTSCTTGCCQWEISQLGEEEFAFAGSGIIEHQGQVVVSLMRDDTIHLARWDGSSWAVEDTQMPAADIMALALHPDDGPMLSINPPGTTGDLIVASEGGGWQSEAVETDGPFESIFGHGDLHVAPDGTPHVVYLYSDSGQPQVMHSSRSGDVWDATYILDYSSFNYSLSVGPDGEPQFTMTDAHHYRSGASWSQDPFDSFTMFSDMEVDSQGRANVCRRVIDADDVGPTLYYFLRDGTWKSEAIDDTNRAGESCAIALDSMERPHIAYCSSCTGDFDTVFDIGFDDIRHAWKDGDQWRISTVTDYGWAQLISTFVDSEDRAHVLYYDLSESTLQNYQYRLMHAVLTPE